MLILRDPYGQLSNRFFQHIHLDSFCRENGVLFFNHFPSDVCKDYPRLKGKYGNIIINAFMKSLPYFQVEGFAFDHDDEIDYYKSLIIKSKFFFCKGWHFRSVETTKKYRPFYQKMFNSRLDKTLLNEQWLSKNYEGEKIVAVHVRGADYKTFADGRYFFNHMVYIEKMQQLSFSLDCNCRFIIFSNDPDLKFSEFTNRFERILFSSNTSVVDHYLMSKCDYIFGPPSTFSMWASYIGETPYYHVCHENDNVELNKFKICDG